jgi:hypothetical protein
MTVTLAAPALRAHRAARRPQVWLRTLPRCGRPYPAAQSAAGPAHGRRSPAGGRHQAWPAAPPARPSGQRRGRHPAAAARPAPGRRAARAGAGDPAWRRRGVIGATRPRWRGERKRWAAAKRLDHRGGRAGRFAGPGQGRRRPPRRHDPSACHAPSPGVGARTGARRWGRHEHRWRATRASGGARLGSRSWLRSSVLVLETSNVPDRHRPDLRTLVLGPPRRHEPRARGAGTRLRSGGNAP